MLTIATALGQDTEQARQPIEVIVASTVTEKTINAAEQPIFQALAQLAREQGHDARDFVAYRGERIFAKFTGGAFSHEIQGGIPS